MMEESRLLNLKEFATYAGGISRNSATKLAKDSKCSIHIGRRHFIDKQKFDAWLDSTRCD
jgi:hypothetical protein